MTTVPANKKEASVAIKLAIDLANKATESQLVTIRRMNNKVTEATLASMTKKQATAMIAALFAASKIKKKDGFKNDKYKKRDDDDDVPRE